MGRLSQWELRRESRRMAITASSLGVSIERVPVVQPASAEQALDIARTLASSGAVGGDKDELCSQAGIDAVADQLK